MIRNLNNILGGSLSVAALTLGLSQSATASTLTFIGDFELSGISIPGTTPDPFSGSWSFEFDESQLDGKLQIFSIPLTDLTLTPNVVGATTFDLSNTSGRLIFNPSFSSVLGGLVSWELKELHFL